MLLKVKTNASRCCLWAKEEAVRGVARHERREKMASGCDILEEFVMVAGVEWATKHSGYTDRKFTLKLCIASTKIIRFPSGNSFSFKFSNLASKYCSSKYDINHDLLYGAPFQIF